VTGWLASGASAVGLVRRRNEDAFAVEPALGLYLVADGMGGHRAGDVASRIARDRVVAAIADAVREGAPADPETVVGEAIAAANRAVHAAATRDPALAGMGTTLSVLRLAEVNRAIVGQVGDSRVYTLGGGRLTQATDDHTRAAELVRAGRLTPAEARGSVLSHMLTRAVGLDAEVAADVVTLPLAGIDAILLCSDGLTGPVDDQAIARLIEQSAPDAQAACEALIAETIAAGAPDNVTAVVLYRS